MRIKMRIKMRIRIRKRWRKRKDFYGFAKQTKIAEQSKTKQKSGGKVKITNQQSLVFP